MLIEKVFRKHKLDSLRIVAAKNHDGSVTLTFMEGDVATTVTKLPEGRDLDSFVEGLLEGIAYQKGEVRGVRLRDAKREIK